MDYTTELNSILDETYTTLDDVTYHTDIQDEHDALIIDKTTRQITPTSSEVLVVGDANSVAKTFIIDRYYDGVDLSTKEIRIVYRRSDGEGDIVSATDIEVSTSKIGFSWVLNEHALYVGDTLDFCVEFIGVDEFGDNYAWHTKRCALTIDTDTVSDMTAVTVPETNWVVEIEGRLLALENGSGGSSGGLTDAQIEAAIAKYLESNPLEESDPTVPSWAKQSTKPTYTADEVGTLSTSEINSALNGKSNTTHTHGNATTTTSGFMSAADKTKLDNMSSGSGTEYDGAIWYPSIADDGVISWEKSSTTTAPTSKNIKGEKGADGANGTNGKDGADGVSPIVNVTATDTGHTVSVVDANGTKVFNVTNGVDGKDGADGTNGKDGVDGTNGTDGKDGVDGKDLIHQGETVSDSGVVSKQLTANVLCMFSGTVSDLTITLPSTYNFYDEFNFIFITDVSGCNLSIPSDCEWIAEHTLDSSTRYEVSIVNNVAVISSGLAVV